MAFFLDEKELGDAYEQSVKWNKQWIEPFDEFERIASGLPNPKIPKNYPQVADGTLAALMLETPMRIWGQLQTGTVKALNQLETNYAEWKTEMSNILWSNKIVPNCNYKAPFFAKLQVAQHRSLVYGSCPLLAFKIVRGRYIGVDFDIPNIRDIKFEPGKVSDSDSDYIFFQSYHSKFQLKKIIASASPDGGWSVEDLKNVVDNGVFGNKDSDDLTMAEKGKDFTNMIKFVTVYHRGVGAPFYTFVPSLGNKIVRILKNSDATGELPLTMLYNVRNLINPYGIGQVELAGPNQNALDFFSAAFMMATQQGIEPPLGIRGPVGPGGVRLETLNSAPRAKWILGNGDVSPIKLSAANNYVEIQSALKTQVMNKQGTSDATISAASGNGPGWSKTPAGVKWQQERTNAKDNYLRQRADEAFAQLAKNLINLYVSNADVKELVELTDDQRAKLEASGKQIPADSKSIAIELSELKGGEFEFVVDANSSRLKDSEETVANIIELFRELNSVPQLSERLAESGKRLDVGEYIRNILAASSLENWEKILVDAANVPVAAASAATEPVGNEILNESTIHPAESPALDFPVITPTQTSPNTKIDESEATKAYELKEQGFDADTITLIMALKRSGWSEDKIYQYLREEVDTAMKDEKR